MRRDTGQRVLVCGGRDYSDGGALRDYLDRYHAEHRIGTMIVGDATGADMLAAAWARSKQVKVDRYRAYWRLEGEAAGPRRNARMLAEGEPHVVIAFPGGTGTRDMIAKARATLAKVIIVDPKHHDQAAEAEAPHRESLYG